MKKKAKRTKMAQTAVRLSAKDFKILDTVAKEVGLPGRSSALRYILRQYGAKILLWP